MKAILLQIKSCYDPKNKVGKTHYDVELDEIRKQIYDSPASEWTTSLQSPEKINLSVAHFQKTSKSRDTVFPAQRIFLQAEWNSQNSF